MNRPESVDELKSVWKILEADLAAAVDYGQAANTEYAQRALIRAFYAAVEGLTFQLRSVILASSGGTGILSASEEALLREERYSLDGTGKPKSSQSFLPFLEGLLFSIRTYVKNHGATYSPDLSGTGWRAMKHATDARNRVTHPKSAASLTLTDHDLLALRSAFDWWHSTMLAMFNACEIADADYRAKSR